MLPTEEVEGIDANHTEIIGVNYTKGLCTQDKSLQLRAIAIPTFNTSNKSTL